jgi:hypothetical protein
MSAGTEKAEEPKMGSSARKSDSFPALALSTSGSRVEAAALPLSLAVQAPLQADFFCRTFIITACPPLCKSVLFHLFGLTKDYVNLIIDRMILSVKKDDIWINTLVFGPVFSQLRWLPPV